MQKLWKIVHIRYSEAMYVAILSIPKLFKLELYKVKEVQKKFKWVGAQLKFKIPLSLPLVWEERGELWTLVECQLIWTSFELF